MITLKQPAPGNRGGLFSYVGIIAVGPRDEGNQIVETPQELKALRDSIDNLDAALVHILAERFKCTQRVGELKVRLLLPSADPDRERTQIERLRSLARSAQLDPDFAEKFLAFIINDVIRHHDLARGTDSDLRR
jgi:chorismate mutase